MDIEQLKIKWLELLNDPATPKPLRESIEHALGITETTTEQTLFGFPVVVAEVCPICRRFINENEIHGHG